MNKLSMDGTFGERKIATRMVLNNLPYNTAIVKPNNGDVAVYLDGRKLPIRQISENIINSKKLSIFKRNAVDPSTYIVYFIDKSRIQAKWGGSVRYEDPKLGGIQESVFIRATYTYFIEDVDLFVENCLTDVIGQYDRAYVFKKINSKIDNIFQQYVFDALSTNGSVYMQQHLIDLATCIQDAVNKNVVSVMGIVIDDLVLTYEEDQLHSEKRNVLEWEVYSNKILKGGRM